MKGPCFHLASVTCDNCRTSSTSTPQNYKSSSTGDYGYLPEDVQKALDSVNYKWVDGKLEPVSDTPTSESLRRKINDAMLNMMPIDSVVSFNAALHDVLDIANDHTAKALEEAKKMTFNDDIVWNFHENGIFISEDLARERWGDEEVEKLKAQQQNTK